ncbi:MAG: glycogen synthase GlgA [Oscillospiraceae bacterium]|nr:glycogen synthase GlgA [Oscillospiraceae bacterium]
MKVLYAVSEAVPFVKTGGLADVAGSLPKALCAAGADTRVILPLYSKIAEQWRLKMDFCFSTYVNLAWRKQYCGVFRLEHEGVTYYFIDNEYYFGRENIYGSYDDGERFGFFSRAVLEVLPLLDWKPDVINCNDWQTALIPIYISQETGGYYSDVKTVFTIHNIEYQGRFGKDILSDVFGLSEELYDSGILRFEKDVNLMKGAIYKSNYITTVSPSYAQELRDPYFACGLHKVIEDNAYKLTGILNGLDISHYNPMKDALIAKKFSATNAKGKKLCKAELCDELGFDETSEAPIIACISRLVGHKGFDLVSDSLDWIISKGARLVILGTGDEKFENYFRDAENRYKGLVSANIMYSEKRASMIYAGADMLLMPSRSEPCGLTQMIAMRYGTVPIVREVGGLRDTVRPLFDENANGFTFSYYSTDNMNRAIDEALNTWLDKDKWQELMKRDMTEDLSWSKSAKEYIKIYTSLNN